MILHEYVRSSASWRLRIALNLKGVAARHQAHDLRRGDQRTPDYLALNPQGLVPALITDEGEVLTQSLAILEWLDETIPSLPSSPTLRWPVPGSARWRWRSSPTPTRCKTWAC